MFRRLVARYLVIGVFISACGVSLPVAAQFYKVSYDKHAVELALDAAYRRDDLDWNIAGPNNFPNVLSELTWSDMQIAQVGARGVLKFWYFQVHGSASYGESFDGENQDSDYDGDNRTQEYSRSNNDADADVRDFDLALGVPFGFKDRSVHRTAIITPMVGYTWNEQNLKMTDGVQTIPATGAFPGLDSSYDTEWEGFWVGLDMLFEARRNIWFEAFIDYRENMDYYAEADWNLRDAFAHPKSFTHEADEGSGYRWRLGFRYAFTKKLTFAARYERLSFTAEDGTDTVFWADGTTSKSKLNEVNWESEVFSLSLGYTF